MEQNTLQNKNIRLSKSAIQSYEQCPWKFWIEYVLRIRPEKIPEAAQMGIDIHNLFDSYFKGNLGVLQNKKEYKVHVDNFINFNEFCKVDPLLHEGKFKDDELNYSGILDRLQTINGETWLIDYKTGNCKSQRWDDKLHRYVECSPIDNYLFELYGYAYLTNKFTEFKVDRVAIFFTAPDGGVVDSKVITQKDIDETVEHIKKVDSEIKEKLKLGESAFKCTKSSLCKWICNHGEDGDKAIEMHKDKLNGNTN